MTVMLMSAFAAQEAKGSCITLPPNVGVAASAEAFATPSSGLSRSPSENKETMQLFTTLV